MKFTTTVRHEGVALEVTVQSLNGETHSKMIQLDGVDEELEARRALRVALVDYVQALHQMPSTSTTL